MAVVFVWDSIHIWVANLVIASSEVIRTSIHRLCFPIRLDGTLCIEVSCASQTSTLHGACD